MATKVRPPPDDGEDAADLAVQESIQRARAVFASGTGKTLDLLREADRSLSERLHAVAQKRGGKSTFTAASAEVYRAQIGVVTKYLEKRLEGHTHEQATKAIRIAVRDTVKVTRALEQRFAGIAKPLSLDSQHQQEETVQGTARSLLRRHQSSVARYGQRMVGDFERVLRAGMIEGLTQEQMVSRLVETGKHGRVNARRLHANEPGSFPQPTSYVRRRYWAERIVRTEVANGHAAAALETMTQTRAKDMPDLQKKILATFDARTAPDSVFCHGQVRKLEEMFTDGAGRQYLRPPARPNDRETIIPWRPRWKETKTTDPKPPAEQAAAAVDAQAKAATKDERRERLRQSLAAARERLAAQKAGQKQAEAVAAPPTPEKLQGASAKAVLPKDAKPRKAGAVADSLGLSDFELRGFMMDRFIFPGARDTVSLAQLRLQPGWEEFLNKKAIQRYTENSAFKVNRKLRTVGWDKPWSPAGASADERRYDEGLKEIARRAAAVMRKEANNTAPIWRGLSVPQNLIDKWVKAGAVSDPAFMSFSTVETKARQFIGSESYRGQWAETGTKKVMLRASGGGYHFGGPEAEVMFAPGTALRIKRVTQEGDLTVIDVEAPKPGASTPTARAKAEAKAQARAELAAETKDARKRKADARVLARGKRPE